MLFWEKKNPDIMAAYKLIPQTSGPSSSGHNTVSYENYWKLKTGLVKHSPKPVKPQVPEGNPPPREK
jgi:hypothetical protein